MKDSEKNNGIKKIFLIDPKDVKNDFLSGTGEVTEIIMKRKYGKRKREIVEYVFDVNELAQDVLNCKNYELKLEKGVKRHNFTFKI